MKFVEYKDMARNRITALEAERLRVGQTWLKRPCALCNEHLYPDWQSDQDFPTLSSLEPLLQQSQPSLILLGSTAGASTDPGYWQLLAALNQRGIGLESMGADAACRTFNVLTTEERQVLLLLV